MMKSLYKRSVFVDFLSHGSLIIHFDVLLKDGSTAGPKDVESTMSAATSNGTQLGNFTMDPNFGGFESKILLCQCYIQTKYC